MQEVEAVCERVLILRNGQLALDRNLAELRSCGELILRTDSVVPDLQDRLLHMPQISGVDPLSAAGDTSSYCLHLHRGIDPDTAAASIACCVQDAGARLYQLERQQKHLDEIFNEVIGSGS
jgi:ABC-2 type transport system ATP-binding protein